MQIKVETPLQWRLGGTGHDDAPGSRAFLARDESLAHRSFRVRGCSWRSLGRSESAVSEVRVLEDVDRGNERNGVDQKVQAGAVRERSFATDAPNSGSEGRNGSTKGYNR